MSPRSGAAALAAVGSLSIGSLTRERHPVGILDTEGFPDELAGIDVAGARMLFARPA